MSRSKPQQARSVVSGSEIPKHYGWLVIALLILGTALVFARALQCGFICLDDPPYIYENGAVRGGLTPRGVTWSLTTLTEGNWHPLTWLSHMLDVSLYGLNPWGHHLTNVLLHIVNAVLLFVLLNRMTGAVWRSAFVAAVFAIHPLRVESVVWVAERKDVLSAVFWMLGIYAYARYAEQPNRRRYASVAALMAIGLTAKPMLVSMPVALLVLDYWPLRRFKSIGARNLVVEKIPLALIAAASSVVTFYAQKLGGAVTPAYRLPVTWRIDNALTAYVGYLWKMLWPADLAVLYPLRWNTIPTWQVIGSALMLAALTCIVLRARRAPYLAMGWLWYVATLVPVIGLVQVGTQSMADRYTYVPLIGLFVMIAWGVPEALSRWRPATAALVPTACAVIAALSVCTYAQIGCWKDSVTLFRHAVEHTTRNDLAQTNLGCALYSLGRREEAAAHFKEALRIDPRDADALADMGVFLMGKGDYAGAASRFRAALKTNPTHTAALANLAFVVLGQGKRDEAEALLARAQPAGAYDPSLAKAHVKMAAKLEELGDARRSVEHYRTALDLDPQQKDAANNLAWIYATSSDPALRNPSEAVRLAELAARAAGGNPFVMDTLAAAYASVGRYADAAEAARSALRLARQRGANDAARRIAERLGLYESGRPYVEK